MRTKHLFFIPSILLLLMAGNFACNEELPFQETILGKWELEAYGPNENEIKPIGEGLVNLEPSYVEFLPNGILNTFSLVTDECTGSVPYKIDSEYLYINYEKSYEQGRYDYMYHFINKDKLKISHSQGYVPYVMGYPIVFIHQRVK